MSRLGISIGRCETRGVLVRAGRVVWHARSAVGVKESVGASVERLVDSAPKTLLKPRAAVAIGLAYSQLKVIEGLPAVKSGVMLARLVRENAESFFLRSPGGLVVTDAFRDAEGAVWAAALDAGVTGDVLAALRGRGFSKVTVVPLAAAVAAIAPAGIHDVADDRVAIQITTIDSGRIARARRVPLYRGLDHAPISELLRDADPTGDFTAALGATTISPTSPFVRRPPRDARTTMVIDRARVGAATALFVASAAAAVAAPGVRATRSAARANRELAEERTAQIEAARVDAELRRVTAQLERVAQFSAPRGRMTELLGALSQALPDSTALVNLRVDSLEASFTALTPHAADILPQLAGLEPVVSPRIVGSVTREAAGSARVERATIRFRRRKAR